MNTFKTTLLLTFMMLLFMGIGYAVGGTDGMYVMFLISAVMNFSSYWYSDKIILKMYKAQEVNQNNAPELVRMVSNLAKKAGMPMPKVYVINTDVPNAFATGRNPENAAVAATTGIMRALSYEELEGVMAHELSHVRNRDTLISTVAATLAGAITMIARWVFILGAGRHSDDDNGGAIGQIALMILAPVAAMLIQMGISRSREFLADEAGAQMTGKPLALASALKKIETYAQHKKLPDATPATSNMFIINPLSGSKVSFADLFSTHPKTAARIEKLEEMSLRIKK